VSPEVVRDYKRILQLDALLAAHEQREDVCPVCGGELVAAESRNGDPFYWRCLVDDCYTRSLDKPAPRDGLLPCASCGGPIEFRQMHRALTGAAPLTHDTASASSHRT